MNSQPGRIVSLDGGTEAVIHSDGKVYLTGYSMYAVSREIPRIYLQPKDALDLAKEILKHVDEPST